MKNYEIDMCRGPLFGKIILFALPLMMTYILQLLFNAADLVIIGHYAHYNAMAAVGATMNLNSLVINIFIGLSVGTNVVTARCIGANEPDKVRRAVHTSMTVAFYGGIALMFIGLAVAKPLLVLMRTPEEILPLSCTYIWICFCAIPFIMIYNFGCAVLRSIGDTRRPLFFLVIAGITNVVLNLFFVIVCGMDVGGIALATAISHGIAAALILRTLLTSGSVCALRLKELGIDREIFRDILKIGIPAGLQSSCFAISNMTIQSSINSFGPIAMAGSTAALSLEGIVYVGSYSYHQTIISFASQNLGGKKFSRIRKSIFYCMGCSIAINLIMGFGFYWFGHTLLAIYNPNEEVIAWGLLRMKILFTTYFLCAIMDVVSGALRGLGHSIQSAVVTMMGVCVLRVLWVCFVFPLDRTMENLMLSYPVSWALTAAVNGYLLYRVCRKLFATSGRHYINLPLAESSLR